MTTVGDRIRMVRECISDKKISMASFADKLGVTSGAVSQWENNQRTPSSAVIVLICKEFNISEEWLRTGKGEMMCPLERDEEIAKIASKMLDEVEPSIRNAFIRAVMATNNETLQALKDFSETFIYELNNPPTK